MARHEEDTHKQDGMQILSFEDDDEEVIYSQKNRPAFVSNQAKGKICSHVCRVSKRRDKIDKLQEKRRITVTEGKTTSTCCLGGH